MEEKTQDNGVKNTEEKDNKDQIVHGVLDSNFPLLKQFREKAPGSYKHAQSLVSMIENVTAALDLDSSTLKVAAMYHDIGKMWNPLAFTENQLDGVNMHDSLHPTISYQLLTRHVSDSVTILIANNFPLEVIRIVSQHHGTCLLKSIVNKVDIKNEDELNMFRYKTQKPDSLESLILMLCDQVEATSRALLVKPDSAADPASIVANIYNQLHLDGQFDNVTILLGNLKKIQEALISDVESTFHRRIEYDKQIDIEENKSKEVRDESLSESA